MATSTRPTTTTSTRPRVYTGDLIFIRPTPDDWAGQIIARETHGPYCHVRVRITQDSVIEALGSRGVVRSYLIGEPDAADTARCGGGLEVDRLAHALTWLEAQIGDGYDWLAIADDALGVILPRGLGARTPFLVAPSRLDCSSLAAKFLIRAGYEWLPDAVLDAPERCSPNDLARALGVLQS
jgi:hypothetical protein